MRLLPPVISETAGNTAVRIAESPSQTCCGGGGGVVADTALLGTMTVACSVGWFDPCRHRERVAVWGVENVAVG